MSIPLPRQAICSKLRRSFHGEIEQSIRTTIPRAGKYTPHAYCARTSREHVVKGARGRARNRWSRASNRTKERVRARQPRELPSGRGGTARDVRRPVSTGCTAWGRRSICRSATRRVDRASNGRGTEEGATPREGKRGAVRTNRRRRRQKREGSTRPGKDRDERRSRSGTRAPDGSHGAMRRTTTLRTKNCEATAKRRREKEGRRRDEGRKRRGKGGEAGLPLSSFRTFGLLRSNQVNNGSR